MQLISCHIENFGKLSGFDMSFTDGLNEVMNANGWGKTTLSTFIKVMLYGFDNESKRSEKEREKYRPWDGGEYGGRLTFKADGKAYTVCRTFGKTAKDDEFKLLDAETGQETDRFSVNLGQELLHIDRDTFFNTLYISQNDRSTQITDDIHARMGSQDDILEDISGYPDVEKKIKKMLDENTPSRKTGSLSKMKTEISEMKQDQKNRDGLEKSEAEQKKKLEEEKEKALSLQEKKKLLQEERSKVTAYEINLAKKKRYEEILEENNRRDEELKQAVKAFVGKRPTKEQCIALQSEANEFLRLSESEKNKRLLDEEEARLNALTGRFVSGAPDEKMIYEYMDKNSAIQNLKVELASKSLSEEEKARLKGLEQIFSEEMTEEQINKQLDNVRALNSLKGQIQQKKSSLDTLKIIEEQNKESHKEENHGNELYWKLPVGVIFTAVGVLVAIVLNVILGVVLSLLGIALLVWCFVPGKKGSEKEVEPQKEPSKADILESEIKKDDERFSELSGIVHTFLSGLNSDCADESMNDKLYDLRARFAEYEKLHTKALEFEKTNVQERVETLERDILGFLREYIPTQQSSPELFESALRTLERETTTYRDLRARKQEWDKAKLLRDESWEKLKADMNKFSLTPETDVNAQLRVLHDDVLTYEACEEEAKKSNEKLEAFAEQENVEELVNLTSPTTTQTADELDMAVKDVEEQIAQTSDNIHAYSETHERIASEIDELDEKARELEEKKEKYERVSEKYEVLQQTREYLEEAKNGLTKRYTEPLLDALSKYYEILSNGEESHYAVDVQMNVELDIGTMPKSLSALSRGYLDLSWMCMRMAFIDAMYPDEKPFIVMDDPFVNMDEKKIEGGRKLLNELAKKYQILYFTCHESRQM